jgi:hypothetical protein
LQGNTTVVSSASGGQVLKGQGRLCDTIRIYTGASV